jgi:hypothetical protein
VCRRLGPPFAQRDAEWQGAAVPRGGIDTRLACEAASVGNPASRLGLQLAISALPCFRASALRQFFDQHIIISFEQE